jgi:hypothetical protein
MLAARTSTIEDNLVIIDNLQLGSGTYLLDSSTSTMSYGINIGSGCFAINGVCVGGGAKALNQLTDVTITSAGYGEFKSTN